MNMSMVVSNYRKVKKNNDKKALLDLMNFYLRVQYFILPSNIYNVHGISGHGSITYAAEKFKQDILGGKLPPNKEFVDAMFYIAGKILEEEETMAD